MIYRLKVTLQDSKPPIWRRLEVDSKVGLKDFHYILQTTMGWTNSHLHQFTIGRESYQEPNEWNRDYAMDYKGMKLKNVLPAPGSKIVYEYDFGDSWGHVILLEAIEKPEPEILYPRVIKGKGACPPEDCGGIWGYMDLLEILKNKKHPQHKEMKEWVGGNIDPTAFDMQQINEELQEDNYGTIDIRGMF
jgi:hypothetical protein